jgi:hypothetical protein
LHSTISEPVRSQGNELLQAHNFALRGTRRVLGLAGFCYGFSVR